MAGGARAQPLSPLLDHQEVPQQALQHDQQHQQQKVNEAVDEACAVCRSVEPKLSALFALPRDQMPNDLIAYACSDDATGTACEQFVSFYGRAMLRRLAFGQTNVCERLWYYEAAPVGRRGPLCSPESNSNQDTSSTTVSDQSVPDSAPQQPPRPWLEKLQHEQEQQQAMVVDTFVRVVIEMHEKSSVAGITEGVMSRTDIVVQKDGTVWRKQDDVSFIMDHTNRVISKTGEMSRLDVFVNFDQQHQQQLQQQEQQQEQQQSSSQSSTASGSLSLSLSLSLSPKLFFGRLFGLSEQSEEDQQDGQQQLQIDVQGDGGSGDNAGSSIFNVDLSDRTTMTLLIAFLNCLVALMLAEMAISWCCDGPDTEDEEVEVELESGQTGTLPPYSEKSPVLFDLQMTEVPKLHVVVPVSTTLVTTEKQFS